MEIGRAQFLAVSAVAAEDLEDSELWVRLDSALVSTALKAMSHQQYTVGSKSVAFSWR
jgi:hypothetical protein